MTPLFDDMCAALSIDPNDVQNVPLHLREGLARFVLHGIKPGSFLEAALSNDLMRAIAFYDERTLDTLHAITGLMLLELPAECYGSRERVSAWIAKGGLSARAAA